MRLCRRFSCLLFAFAVSVPATCFGDLMVDALGVTTTVTFDATLADSNNGAFDGSGFSATPAAGQLDSDTWRATGFSDGSGTFGGTHTLGDFARGSDPDGVTTGGVYAFEHATNNFGLGVQPTGGDFTVGEITLRIQNDTGSAATEFRLPTI